MVTTLSLTAAHCDALRCHLFPGDGLEAVAFLLCGRREGDRRYRLVVQAVIPIPYSACRRAADSITWETDAVVGVLERAAANGLSVMKVHSHPSGYPQFSATDDLSDSELLPIIRGWVEGPIPHGSVIMLPDGRLFGRVLDSASHVLTALERISVIGDDIVTWFAEDRSDSPGFLIAQRQAFGEGTTQLFRRFSFGVVGCSGTGSPTIEMLMRLGAGEIVPVDHDVVEDRNLNRILHATAEDARQKRLKTNVVQEAIERTGLGTAVLPIATDLWTREAVLALAQCDVVFGCMDTVDGRFLLNSLATTYLIPYFDIGVRLENHLEGGRKGTIREVCGTVNYLQPGRSSLMSRGLFSMTDVAAAGLRRKDPAAFAQQVRERYIRGGQTNRPAVVSVNTFGASLAVNELIARLHPYREASNMQHSSVCFSLASMELLSEPEDADCPLLAKQAGVGDREPLLGLVELGGAS